MEVLVSIVVPCYNQAHYLKESLQSVLDQTFSDWECIIVNDGSPDNTKEVSKTWVKKDSRFTYLEKQNGGLSSARNAGIQIAKGEFILPLDADDILHPDYLQKAVPLLKENKHLGIVSCFSNFFYQNTSNVVFQLKPIGSTWEDLLFVNQLIATSLFKRECWEKVGGYDERMKKGFEDWDFWLSVTKKGYHYEIVHEFLFFYRKAKISMLQNTVSNHFYEVRKGIMLKHKDLYVQKFENVIEVLFFELQQKNDAYQKNKRSLEFKIGKWLTKPLKWLEKISKK
ncbi:glycosyltransferase family 2 protein [Flavobacterium luminosum]|uniref:Glycosyltransferase family 2 protein n=1 Tax=Flavobacterium luminosum TaxID=2949086 RepID=A0ABT0TNL2_9FLAO|nr:glycosyltransferase family A protein [Flavobacterium sp. HXWNR70]MCL9809091.1 glycosyltransferase family 2 protein [Flavobacterium sp. HXWNR70]